MFSRPEKVDAIRLEDEILRILERMEHVDQETKEYRKLVENLGRLYEMRTGNRPRNISPDTIATVAANLLGILIIVAYEQKHVFNSRSLSFVQKTTV